MIITRFKIGLGSKRYVLTIAESAKLNALSET
jgi:hypothetical protein